MLFIYNCCLVAQTPSTAVSLGLSEWVLTNNKLLHDVLKSVWCLWKDLSASKQLREIACIQYTTDGLWRQRTQLASCPPTLHIHPADHLSCATQWCAVMACWWWGLDFLLSGWGRLPASCVRLTAYGSDMLSSHLILPPSVSILLIAFLAPLNGAWWWPVDGEVLCAHLSKEVTFLLQCSHFISELLIFESETVGLAEVNGSHPWRVYDKVWMDSIAWILELDGM
jgi:hypothetical protein